VVQGIARIHEVTGNDRRGHTQDKAKFLAESDFRKGGSPAGF
jgi:hypothetical protein